VWPPSGKGLGDCPLFRGFLDRIFAGDKDLIGFVQRALGYALTQVYYCAESVLLPEYRGRGIGHAFFDAREAKARSLGRKHMAFCSVKRPDDHPARPATFRTNDAFWRGRGYAPLEGVFAEFSWRDIGGHEETPKTLQVWFRTL
jgi:GNAT superfamily N-acetyltransferase